MREFDFRAFHIQAADNMLSLHESRFNPDWSETHMSNLIYMFTKRPMFREVIETWRHAKGLGDPIILEAHGGFQEGQWVYYENDQKTKPVQEWVDEMDGTAVILMITSCNPFGSGITSQESLVMHTARLVGSLPDMILTRGLIRLYVPGRGYLEHDYKKLRRIINGLKALQ